MMVLNKNNGQDVFDAFSDMPSWKKKTGDTGGRGNVGIMSDTSTNDGHFIDGASKTTGYTVKKITAVTHSKNRLVESSTGFQAISIDTDEINKKNNGANTTNDQEKLSIDTNEFTSAVHGSAARPVIIDETECGIEQEINPRPVVMVKKEKPVPQRSISLDISSDMYTHAMPSAEREEALGSGKVIGVLGSGGMARVYKIWNEKLEIFRAVKILLPSTIKEQQERFLTEAKITAKLHHPNIIETYDIGEWHGLPIIEMELIEGLTLNTIISDHQTIPSPVCASIAFQIARALEYAHSQEMQIYGKMYKGIIHRDLKPSNIMVAPSGRVTLMDFGVARPLETGLHTVVTDSIVGTIHYFSPEQIDGYPIDHLTDVYSFGAVLYELLCARNPFPYSNMVDMIQAKTKNQFRRLEDYPIEMDRRIASVAQICLRTDKRERYPDFHTIVQVLGEIQTSYGMGTCEEIIAEFNRNPGKIATDYKKYADSCQKEVELKPLDDVPKNGTITAAKKVPVHTTGEQWEPFRLSVKKIIVGVIAVVVAVLLAGWFLNGAMPTPFSVLSDLIDGSFVEELVNKPAVTGK